MPEEVIKTKVLLELSDAAATYIEENAASSKIWKDFSTKLMLRMAEAKEKNEVTISLNLVDSMSLLKFVNELLLDQHELVRTIQAQVQWLLEIKARIGDVEPTEDEENPEG